jgi:hypothetical protein
MEEVKNKRGGRREGAGRPKGVDTTLISVKLETELLRALPLGINRSKYVNDAVREKMVRDGIIMPLHSL